jgi:CBS domain-containing protein
MEIQDIMSTPPITCRVNDHLDTAARLMWEHDCGSVPVTDDQGRLVGMITDRDICMATLTRGSAPVTIRVADTMAKQVFSISCRRGELVEVAERAMREQQVRRIPIVDDENRPIGVLSISDIARYVLSRDMVEAHRELTRTLAAISQPRSRGRRTQRPAAA